MGLEIAGVIEFNFFELTIDDFDGIGGGEGTAQFVWEMKESKVLGFFPQQRFDERRVLAFYEGKFYWKDRIYDDHRSGLLNIDGYKRQIDRIREERKRLTLQMAKAQREIDGAYLATTQRVLA